MAELTSQYDSSDQIPEAIEDFRSLFTEKNGKFELTGIAGMKTTADVARVQTALDKERSDHSKTKDRLKVWGDMEHDDIVAKLDRIDELEAAAGDKLDDAKIEELANKRVEGTLRTKLAPVERDLAKAAKERDEATNQLQALQTDITRRDLHDHLRPMLVKAKVIPEHHEDVFMYAERELERAEDGGFFSRDGLAAGITAGLNAQDWLGEKLERRPGWLPPNVGGGARGSTTGGIGSFAGKNPWTADAWNMTEQGRIYTEKGEDYAKKLAAQAGTTIGGPKPKPKS